MPASIAHMLIAHKALQKLKGKGLSIYYLLLTIYYFGWDCHSSLLGMMGNGFLLAGMTRRILTGRLRSRLCYGAVNR